MLLTIFTQFFRIISASEPVKCGRSIARQSRKAPMCPGGGRKFAGLGDDDPLAAARGAVNGALFGSLVWAVVLWALL